MERNFYDIIPLINKANAFNTTIGLVEKSIFKPSKTFNMAYQIIVNLFFSL